MALRRRFSERPLRLPRLRPYVPAPDAPAVYWFNSERDDIIADVVSRVAGTHGARPETIELMLNDAALHEVRRLTSQRDEETAESLGFWKGVSRGIARMSDTEKRHVLATVAERMARDVAGNFDPRVFEMATAAGPRILSAIMQPSRVPIDLASGSSAVDELLTVEGDVAHLRRLQAHGTLVYVPTHSSNLDSIVLAQALERKGLSPVVYGAGKNLFTNPIIAFGMHNLGAYRVDRRIRAHLYKDVLKAYASVMVERGYHSLFFPGGTRSRSGLIEQRLKLGLLGSAVEAFSRNQVHGVPRRVFIVPTTINYALVLEAETLVEDWLKEEGQARFIITDDEFSRIERWYDFFRRLRDQRAACVIRFGAPVDPFGNPVDADGQSLTPGGRVIDPGSYVLRRGEPTLDAARDQAYTRELGDVLSARYLADTVLMTTNVVAHAIFRHFVRETPSVDLFSRLRLRGDITIARAALRREVAQLQGVLLTLEERGKVRVSHMVRTSDAESLIERALQVWLGYHKRIAAREVGDYVSAEDPALLIYYQNRLVPFATLLAADLDAATQHAAQEISRLGAHR
ncbi:MAG: 1-acyl-sn-glycerol-3-phosphate acyltransferase [Myxococcales bacterium]|nr:1-acyl-sn-glycerol-3-phosphate acyltransferase [Myxococcales bacterium]